MTRLFSAFVLFIAAGGCLETQGEHCQVTTDCQAPLVCELPRGGSLAEGGTCQPPLPVPDGGDDMPSGADLATDGAQPDDLSAPDLPAPDLSAPDLVTPADLVIVPDLTSGG